MTKPLKRHFWEWLATNHTACGRRIATSGSWLHFTSERNRRRVTCGACRRALRFPVHNDSRKAELVTRADYMSKLILPILCLLCCAACSPYRPSRAFIGAQCNAGNVDRRYLDIEQLTPAEIETLIGRVEETLCKAPSSGGVFKMRQREYY